MSRACINNERIEVMAQDTLRSFMEIKEFQNIMRELYAHNDRRRGKDKTMLWLVEEVLKILYKNKANL
jgi:hypothetical protein